MKHTNVSNIVYPTLILSKGSIVNTPTEVKQFDRRDITICPALMLAMIRTVKVRGRISILTVSITTRKGIRTFGAPAGVRWAADSLGNLTQPDKINANHSDTAKLLAVQRELVLP